MKKLLIIPIASLISLLVNAQNIYIAGFESNGKKNIAKYWKNTAPIMLTDGKNDAFAESIFVTGQDVYVAGYEYNGRYYVAKYWKNGAATSLTDGTWTAYAYSITVSGNDVYVCGVEWNGKNNVAKYWKNGVAVNLTDGTEAAQAKSIAVKDGDVYVAGAVHKNSKWVATYWKNGTATALSDGKYSAEATSVVVTDKDVYVGGYETKYGTTPQYWKNGNPTVLSRYGDAFPRSMAVAKKDVYLCGWQSSPQHISTSHYWKNEKQNLLLGKFGSNTSAEAYSIALWGKDIYVAGYSSTSSNHIACYWKNGTAFLIGDDLFFRNASEAKSIFITE